MKYIIIDDEPLAREGIRLNADKIDYLQFQKAFPNPIAVGSYIRDNEVDIVFLDIEMPGLSGLEFLGSSPFDAQVILTTAYPQYALEAYEYNVTDYLVKPIRFERFFKAVEKAKSNFDLLQREAISVEQEAEFVYIRSERTIIKIMLSQLKYIKGMKDYVMLFTDDNKYMTAMNIKTIFAQLPHEQFARVSKSYIVNVNRIQSIANHDISIDELEIAIGESYRKEFYAKHINTKIIDRK